MATFTNNIVPIERNHYACIPTIDIDLVLKIDKRAYPQAYLEQCKYKLKKRKSVILLILKLLITIVMIVKIIMKIELKLKVKMKTFQCLLIMKKYNYF